MQIFYLLIAILIPSVVFGSINYSHSEIDAASMQMKISITVDDYNNDINCGGLPFWGVQAIEHKTGQIFEGSPRFVPASTLSSEFTINLPEGDYEEIMFSCSHDGENLAFQFGSLEKDLSGDQIIFQVTEEDLTIDLIDDGVSSTTEAFSIIKDLLFDENDKGNATGTVSISSESVSDIEEFQIATTSTSSVDVITY